MTETVAREMAQDEARRGVSAKLWVLVDTCHPGEPVRDSAAPAQPAEPEPERFKVGETVEVVGYMWDMKWRKARVEHSDGPLHVVQFLDGPYLGEADRYSDRDDQIRRPVPAPKPLAFGDKVKCGFDIDGSSDAVGKIGIVIWVSDMFLKVAIDGEDETYSFESSQLTPI